MDTFLEKIKKYYNLDEEGFSKLIAKPSFANIPLINDHPSVIKAKERIEKAIKDNEKIIIYGDYDCDGIMSTSIIYYSLLKLNKHVSFFIPSRFKDGYGLNLDNAKKIAKAGYSLLICVDNGVNCFEAISYLKGNGIDTLIIDHHEIGESLPEAISIIHDDLLDYGEYNVSAGYLSFLFSICLLGKVDPYLLVLGAISIISDTMPMKSYNREIVALALSLINKNKYPTIFNLTNATYIDEKVLGMEIVPSINAVGRIDTEYDANKLVHYFATDCKDLKQSSLLALEYNKNRKEMTKAALAEIDIDKNKSSVCIYTSLGEGLNGLLASRIVVEENKPVAIFSSSYKDKDILAGSLRSKPGLNLIDFFSSLGELPIRKGGHSFAAGVAIKKEDYEIFKEKLEEYASSHPFTEPKKDEISISLSDISMENYKILRKFAPFGHDYEEPTFVIENVPTSTLKFNRLGYLTFKISPNSEVFSFSIKDDILNKPSLDMEGKFRLNEFRGSFKIQFACNEKK